MRDLQILDHGRLGKTKPNLFFPEGSLPLSRTLLICCVAPATGGFAKGSCRTKNSCRVLKLTPFFTLLSRNLRKRSAKMIFYQKGAPKKNKNGVHLSTHEFSPFFFLQLTRSPLSRRGRVHGGYDVCAFFGAQRGGQRVWCDILGQTRGADGFLPLFGGGLRVFCSFSVFGGAGRPKRSSRSKSRGTWRRRRSRGTMRRRIRRKKKEEEEEEERRRKKKKEEERRRKKKKEEERRRKKNTEEERRRKKKK